MTLFFIHLLSWTLSRLPESVCAFVANRLGDFVFTCMRSRRRLVLSNLSHAFPDKPRVWLLRTGRQSCRHMVETGMLALVHPNLTISRIAEMMIPHAELGATLAAVPTGRAAVIVSPHLGAWELCPAIPVIIDAPLPPIYAMYRPLKNPHLDTWMRESRERFGVRTLSRKKGFAEGMEALRAGGMLGVLFDQNARDSGTLSLLFDRTCSTTNLPGLLVEKYDAVLLTLFARRVGFWRYEMVLEIADDAPRDANGVTIYLNNWLEGLLRSDDALCATWLWVHNRWKTQVDPARRLRLEHKRSILPATPDLPRRTRFYVRLPDTLGAVNAALPALAALRISRPDAALTAVGEAEAASVVEPSGVFDSVITLPRDRAGRRALHRTLRWRFPDCWLVLSASDEAAREVRLTDCSQRFGIVRPGQKNGALSHTWEMPVAGDTSSARWFEFLTRFGLDRAAGDKTPSDTP